MPKAYSSDSSKWFAHVEVGGTLHTSWKTEKSDDILMTDGGSTVARFRWNHSNEIFMIFWKDTHSAWVKSHNTDVFSAKAAFLLTFEVS